VPSRSREIHPHREAFPDALPSSRADFFGKRIFEDRNHYREIHTSAKKELPGGASEIEIQNASAFSPSCKTFLPVEKL